MSVNEKNEMKRRQKQMEDYENELVMRYAEQQQLREDEIRAKKAEMEAAREGIFQKLKEEEEIRRAQKSFIFKNLRNRLVLGSKTSQRRRKESSKSYQKLKSTREG